MNPAFWLLVILALVGVWYLLSPIFRSIGAFFIGMNDNAKKHMFDYDDNRKEK